jgi:hypothetical protein
MMEFMKQVFPRFVSPQIPSWVWHNSPSKLSSSGFGKLFVASEDAELNDSVEDEPLGRGEVIGVEGGADGGVGKLSKRFQNSGIGVTGAGLLQVLEAVGGSEETRLRTLLVLKKKSFQSFFYFCRNGINAATEALTVYSNRFSVSAANTFITTGFSIWTQSIPKPEA